MTSHETLCQLESRIFAIVSMFRLLQATTLGAAMSMVALSIMGILFFSETAAFARSKIVTSITLDENTQPQLRLNFNITMLDLKCDWAVIDVVSALGTDQNVTAHVQKWDCSFRKNLNPFCTFMNVHCPSNVCISSLVN